MKITGKSNRPRGGAVGGGQGAKSLSIQHSPFFESLQHEIHEPLNIAVAVEAIDEYSRKLRQNPTFEHLRRYKEAVRRLLKAIIGDMYQVQEKSLFDSSGRRRLYILVENVDSKLEELTTLFFQKEMVSLEITATLDEIRGMLLDLYS